MYGELVPLGGGDPIPLRKKSLLVAPESCDIVLRFPNVSAHHCQLTLLNGYWYVHDMQSRNGVKVNNLRVTEKRIDPGDTLAVAKHRYEIHYSPAELGAVAPPTDEDRSEIFQKSLLERAGLLNKGRDEMEKSPLSSGHDRRRYDLSDDGISDDGISDDEISDDSISDDSAD